MFTMLVCADEFLEPNDFCYSIKQSLDVGQASLQHPADTGLESLSYSRIHWDLIRFGSLTPGRNVFRSTSLCWGGKVQYDFQMLCWYSCL